MREYVERFLTPLQRLRRLQLVISTGAESLFLNAYKWKLFIVEHLPQLLKFNFKYFSWDIDHNIIDQYRQPFWLDRHWYIAYDISDSTLFTVPHFAPSSVNYPFTPISSDCTTLPIEQHLVFYDCVTELTYESNQYKPPYRYNHVKKFILNSPYIHGNILDLSKVQFFIINTSDWSFFKIMALIKEAMPCVNYLTLNCTYPGIRYQYNPNISLEQIRILSLPQYGIFEGDDTFKWSRIFPCVERLIASINSKKQIRFLINHFKNMISGFFYIDSHHIDPNKQIKITRQWLEKHIYRFKEKNTNNFICRINNQFVFSLCLWIAENNEPDQPLQTVRDGHWWHQCLPWNMIK